MRGSVGSRPRADASRRCLCAGAFSPFPVGRNLGQGRAAGRPRRAAPRASGLKDADRQPRAHFVCTAHFVSPALERRAPPPASPLFLRTLPSPPTCSVRPSARRRAPRRRCDVHPFVRHVRQRGCVLAAIRGEPARQRPQAAPRRTTHPPPPLRSLLPLSSTQKRRLPGASCCRRPTSGSRCFRTSRPVRQASPPRSPRSSPPFSRASPTSLSPRRVELQGPIGGRTWQDCQRSDGSTSGICRAFLDARLAAQPPPHHDHPCNTEQHPRLSAPLSAALAHRAGRAFAGALVALCCRRRPGAQLAPPRRTKRMRRVVESGPIILYRVICIGSLRWW